MRLLWTTTLWFAACLIAGAVFAAQSKVPAEPIPSVHLVRINDPIGLQGFDLQCRPEEDGKAEPECFVTEVKGSKTLAPMPVAFQKAKQIASAFLDRMPKDKIHSVGRGKETSPPVGDTLMVWNVRLGDKATNGSLKRYPTEAERDSSLKRAVLLLESDLGSGSEE